MRRRRSSLHLPARPALLQEMLTAQAAAAAAPHHAAVDVDDLLDDPDLEKLHAERLAQLQREVEKRAAMQRKGHGASCCRCVPRQSHPARLAAAWPLRVPSSTASTLPRLAPPQARTRR